MIIFLDTSILGLASSPEQNQLAFQCREWIYRLLARSVYIVSSNLCDYELRRSLILASFTKPRQEGIDNLDFLHNLVEFLPVTSNVLILAARLWAETRRQGLPTAEVENIDADVIIGATCQLLSQEYPGQRLIAATTNVKHLSRFIEAKTWQEIKG